MNKLLFYGIMAMISSMMPGLAADEYYNRGEMGAWHDRDQKMMMGKLGKHGMTGMIETIDQKTGWLKVKTPEGSLTVHFPPDAIKDLKSGDTITVHLGFTKGGETMGGKMMK